MRVRPFLTVLLGGSLLSLSAAGASTLWVCEASATHRAATAPPMAQRFLEPGRPDITLSLSSDAPRGDRGACSAVTVPVDPQQVVWSTLISRRDASQLAGGLALQGIEQGGRLEVSDIIALAPSESPPRDPLDASSAAAPSAPTWRPFGTEERARIDGNALVCAPGQAPAGFIGTPAQPWPGGHAQHVLIQASGRGRVSWALADAPRQQNEAPQMLGDATLTEAPTTLHFAVPNNTEPWRALTLICPPDGARVEITALALRPTRPQRSAWVWSPALWADTPERVWALQQQHALDAVYVTVPTEGAKVRNEGLLRDFVARASVRGLRVWAVIGDPADVLAAQQPALAERLQAYRRYQGDASPDARLAGVQLDIEPYLLPGYRLDPAAWRERYLQTVALARHALGDGVPLDLVVPVWWGTDSDWGAAALDRLAPLRVSLTVMNYRTDLQAVRAGAEPFLQWAARHQRDVTMALEYGPIADEVRRHYRPSQDGGALWLLPVGQRFALLLLKDPHRDLPGRGFAFTHQSAFTGSHISFAGRPAALTAVVGALAPAWWHRPGFAGIALHGLDGTP